jgi:DNA-binding LytR/AlgR family response regulator
MALDSTKALPVVAPFRLLDGGRDGSVLQPEETTRIVARHKKNLVFLSPEEVWAFEAAERLAFVHAASGRFDIDVSLAEIEACAFGGSFVRVHRSWLANLTHVKELRAEGGLTQLFVGTRAGEDAKGMCVPVARDLARTVRETLLASAIGLRRRD